MKNERAYEAQRCRNMKKAADAPVRKKKKKKVEVSLREYGCNISIHLWVLKVYGRM